MIDKFDLRKYLVENKVTTTSKLFTEVETVFDPAQKRSLKPSNNIYKVVDGFGIPAKYKATGPGMGLVSIELVQESNLAKLLWRELLSEFTTEMIMEIYYGGGGVDLVEEHLGEWYVITPYARALGAGIWKVDNDDQVSFYTPRYEAAKNILSTLLEAANGNYENLAEAYSRYNTEIVTVSHQNPNSSMTVRELWEKFGKTDYPQWFG